jgi:nicotinamidase-related amidase
MEDVLIVVDMQNDFIDGSLGTKEAQAIVDNVKKKVDEYTEAGKLVYFTRDTHEKDYLETFEGKNLPVEHCISGTEGWQICDALKEASEKYELRVINKHTFGFIEWDALNEFWDAESIEVCGLCTDICVISNALILRASYPEKPIIVDSTCCAGVTPEKHEAALEVMRSCQINVI